MASADIDHPIVIEPAAARVRVFSLARQIADTVRALTLKEPGYAPVLYLPRADVDMTLLRRGTRTTLCPYKGVATYYAIEFGGDSVADAGWSYEDPKPVAEEIRGFISFLPQLLVVETPAGDGREHLPLPTRGAHP